MLFAAGERRAAVPYTEELTTPVNEAFVIDGGVNYDVLAWPMERRLGGKVLTKGSENTGWGRKKAGGVQWDEKSSRRLRTP